MKLYEVEIDKTKPMVCCGCKKIGPAPAPGEWYGWFLTKVIYLGQDHYGNHLYQGAAHCGQCNSDEFSWSISTLQKVLEDGTRVVALQSQSEFLSKIGWHDPMPTVEALSTILRIKRGGL